MGLAAISLVNATVPIPVVVAAQLSSLETGANAARSHPEAVPLNVDRDLPHGAWAKMMAQIEADQYGIRAGANGESAPGSAYEAGNPAQRYDLSFDPSGVTASLRTGAHSLGMTLEAWGYGSDLRAVDAPVLAAQQARIEYRRGPITEWYVNRASGLEQGFTLSAPPAARDTGGGQLTLAIGTATGLEPRSDDLGQSVRFHDAAGTRVMSYGKLAVWDAAGRTLAARLDVDPSDGRRLLLRVDDRGARYPVTIDPTIVNETRKFSGPYSSSHNQFGYTVAIHNDVAAVGAVNGDGAVAGSGAVYVFRRDQGGADNWGEVRKLEGVAAGDEFGYSLDLRSGTLVVGAPMFDPAFGLLDVGAVFVFERHAGGTNNWGQTKRIDVSLPFLSDRFGHSVAIDGAADTIAVGAPEQSVTQAAAGRVYVYDRDQGGAGNWGETATLQNSIGTVQQFQRLGTSVDISGDTVIAGAPGYSVFGVQADGAAFVFQRDQGGAGNWGVQATLSFGAPQAAPGEYGRVVSVSTDTAAVSFKRIPGATTQGQVEIYDRVGSSWSLTTTVLSPETDYSDHYGTAIDLRANRLYVGAPLDDDTAVDSGAVYVYDRDQGGADNWGQLQKLKASDAAVGDRFGSAVARDAAYVLVGADNVDNPGTGSGSAYMFKNNAGTLVELVETDFSDASGVSDGFGLSVAMSGSTVAVGAPLDDTNGNDTGAVYLFDENQGGAGNWGQVTKIPGSSSGYGSEKFGTSIGLDGDWLIVGAPGDSVPAANIAGAAYLHARDQGGTDNWGQVKKLAASDAAVARRFGATVGVSGDSLVIGAPTTNVSVAGAVYVFDRNQGGADNWGEVRKVVSSDSAANDQFGYSLAFSGDTFVAGLPPRTGVTGAAYVFDRDQGGADNWGEVKKLLGSDSVNDDFFGSAVAIDGDTIVVGAYGNDYSFRTNVGAAYVFERDYNPATPVTPAPDFWGERTKLELTSPLSDDTFYGRAVAVSGDRAAIGMPGWFENRGQYLLRSRNEGGANAWGGINARQAAVLNVGDNFGSSIVIEGERILVGTDKTLGVKPDSTGAAFLFEVDGDGDGLPDAYEDANGLDPADPSDATEDPDHDGYTTLEEYQAGTDPNDYASNPGPGAAARVLLVDDDDNTPDVRSAYTDALDALGVAYNFWNTSNSDTEPAAADLAQYDAVIWMTGAGNDGATGPGAAGETALGTYLDAGGCLVMSSQSYYTQRGLTAFMSGYLGASAVTDDVAQATVTGAGAFAGLGPYALSYGFTNASDAVQADGTAAVIFSGDQGDAAIGKDSGTYKTAYLGFPFEALPDAAAREAVMGIMVELCEVEAGTVKNDFNGDATTDLLWQNALNGRNVMWFMDGAARVGSGDTLGVSDPDWSLAGFGDFNGDHRADMLWRSASTGRNVIWLMDGLTRIGDGDTVVLNDPDWSLEGLEDFDGDGKTDFLWRNTVNGRNVVWFMDGITRTGSGDILGVAVGDWYIAGFGDFNADRKADLLWRSASTGRNVIWLMDGLARIGYGDTVPLSNPDWSLAGLEDFDGDGMTDLLWRSASTGRNVMWFMDGFTRIGSGDTIGLNDPDWSIAGFGDFDGNRTYDFLWHSASTGRNVMWFMDGTTRTGAADTVTLAYDPWFLRLE